MKNKSVLLVCLLLAAMLLGLTACGKEKAPSDPNHLVIGDYVLRYKGAELMTDTDGLDAVVMTLDFTNNGKDAACYLWSVFCTAVQDGTELEGAVIFVSEDSYETVGDSQFTEAAPGETVEVRAAYTLRDTTNPVEVSFSDLSEKYKETITVDPSQLSRASTDPTTMPAEPTDAEEDALLRYWNGEWYGWWTVASADGEFADWKGNRWDCRASIDINADYMGSVMIWDEDLPKDNALCEAEVGLSSSGTGEYGTVISEGGYFMDGELNHADWIVDPALTDYDHMICIDGWYETDEGSFKYEIYLRPWGMLWDDVAADSPDDLPYYYESWYLPLVEAGKTAPDEIGGDAPEAAPSGEPETSATEAENGGEAIEYGKSNPDATGITTLEAMQALYKICYENRTSGYHVFTYEDAVEALGCDGVIWQKGSVSWNETKHTYRWVTEDGAEYFNISFELEDGEEWYFSCNFSDNVKDGLW